MTLQQLTYVLALDKYRHFVRASKACFVAQPTLTLQVKKLEDEIGLTLFDRSAKPIRLTEIGEKFIEETRKILKDVDHLKKLVNEDKNELKGTYRLGIIPTLAPSLLPLFLKEFSSQHPEVQLEIKEVQSDDLIRALKRHEVDLGIMATPTEEKGIREVTLFYEPFLVYAAAGNPLLEQKEVNPEQLSSKGIWLLSQGHCFRNQLLNICNLGNAKVRQSGFTFESGSIETLKNMIQANSGYTLIPELAVNKKTDLSFIRPLVKPQPAREISLVVNMQFSKELLLQRLRKSILESVPKNYQKNESFVRVEWK